MKLTTTKIFTASPEALWPLLFGSKMDDKQPCYFLFGLPKPVECRLKNNMGGVGQTRECVSDKGTIQQIILEWEPNKKLKFKLLETDIYFGPCIESIVETFEIKPVNVHQTAISRETEFKIIPGANFFISIPMLIGLKSIHRYVFNNWSRIVKI
jgi:hypothetical protein